jgi:hypothetical protein
MSTGYPSFAGRLADLDANQRQADLSVLVGGEHSEFPNRLPPDSNTEPAPVRIHEFRHRLRRLSRDLLQDTRFRRNYEHGRDRPQFRIRSQMRSSNSR